MVEIELPYPPSVNHYYRHVGPRTLISREGRRYRQQVRAILRAQRVRLLEGPLAMWIDAYPPDRRRRDADNLLKSCLDSLQHGELYLDDSQIKELHVHMREPLRPAGKAVVKIGPLSHSTPSLSVL